MYADAIADLSEEDKEVQTLEWIAELEADESYEPVGVVERMKLATIQLTNLVRLYLFHIVICLIYFNRLKPCVLGVI